MNRDAPNAARGDIARRLAGHATNLLASGLVLIAGVLLGREMLEWWHHNRSPSTNAEAMAVATRNRTGPEQPDATSIRFGEHPSVLHRAEVNGDNLAALSMLKKACRNFVSSAQPRGTSAANPWLKQIASRNPAERVPGQWALYELHEPLPLVVVVSDEGQVAKTAGDLPTPSLLAWAIAFPIGESGNRWRTFAFSPPDQQVAVDTDLAIPEVCERLLTIQDDGETTIAFRSDLSPATLAERWDSMQAGGWQASSAWQTIGSSWRRRYELRGRKVEVQFASDARGHALGVCFVR